MSAVIVGKGNGIAHLDVSSWYTPVDEVEKLDHGRSSLLCPLLKCTYISFDLSPLDTKAVVLSSLTVDHLL